MKAGILFLGRRRPGFDMDWGRQMEGRVRAYLETTGLEIFEPSEKAIDEPSLNRALDACETARVQALVLLQTTLSDGRLAPTVAQRWPDPVVLWATPEKPDGDMISSCSLVGTHVWASTFRHMRHPFEIVYGHPDSAETRRQFREAVDLAAVARRLRSVRLGAIGGQAPGYFAMGAEPFVMEAGLGIQLQTFSLLEFANVVNEISPAAVEEDVAKVKALKIPYKDIGDDDLPMASRLYLAMRWFLENERLDAMTIREWPEMPNTFGQWPYLGLARLTDEGRAIGCEGDADGALTAWIGEGLGFGRCYLSDWLEHDRETITVWHVGAAPFSLSPPPGEPGGPRLARHFNIKKPVAIEATLRENMPVTIARFWRCEGKYYLTAREGQTLRPKRHLMATNGLARLDKQDVNDWFDELCHAGMPHHVALFEGHHAGQLRRLGRALNIPFV